MVASQESPVGFSWTFHLADPLVQGTFTSSGWIPPSMRGSSSFPRPADSSHPISKVRLTVLLHLLSAGPSYQYLCSEPYLFRRRKTPCLSSLEARLEPEFQPVLLWAPNLPDAPESCAIESIPFSFGSTRCVIGLSLLSPIHRGHQDFLLLALLESYGVSRIKLF